MVDIREDGWTKGPVIDGRTRSPMRNETLGTHTRDQFQRRDRVRVFLLAPQTIPNNVPTLVAWTSVDYNEAGMYVATDNTKITMYQADTNAFAWHVFTNIVWDPAAAGGRRVEILKNGTVTVEVAGPGSAAIEIAQAVPILADNLVAGDFFQVRVLQNSGAPLNIVNSLVSGSFFQAISQW